VERVSSIVDNQGIRAVEWPNCGLCGGSGRILHENLADRLFGVPGVWSLRECGRCGLVWLSPRPLADDLEKLYRGYHTHRAPEQGSLLKRAVRRGVPARLMGYGDAVGDGWERRLGWWLSWIGPLREVGQHGVMWLPAERRGRLLDVGCGSGSFLGHMRGLGWTVSGVDSDPDAVDQARRALGSDEVHLGSLEELELEDASYEAITMSHVLEHLPDPAGALRACRRLLVPGGCLVVATPNVRSLGSRALGPDWRGWEPPRHIHLFDPATLARLVEAAGLKVQALRTISAGAYFFWLGSVLPESVTGRAKPGQLLRAKGLAFWAREYLLNTDSRPIGEEALVLAEKEGG
jgi:2-polyprenyl-3-methyl-5-hydroxy-6-metoxy-1,4-benzoquinol methylase